MTITKVAVLDDYQGFSEPHFSKLEPSKYEVAYFKDTQPAYNRADTPQSAKDALVERLKPFDVISSMRERTPFPAELISRLPNLKLLLSTGARNLAIDMNACKERGIPVTGTSVRKEGAVQPGGPDNTTQHTVAMILALVRHIAQDDAAVKSGQWQTGFATSLSNKTLGVVGLGRLGLALAKIMHSVFGMKIIAWSTNLTQDAADANAKDAGLPIQGVDGENTFKVVSRADLFRQSDVVSVHLVLSDRSRGLITEDDLSKMKKSAFFLNTSRGPLVVQEDLIKVLERGGIRGAGLDVFDVEPLPVDSPWRRQDWGKEGRSQVLLTPHMGYVEEESLNSWYKMQVEDLERWSNGEELALRMA